MEKSNRVDNDAFLARWQAKLGASSTTPLKFVPQSEDTGTERDSRGTAEDADVDADDGGYAGHSGATRDDFVNEEFTAAEFPEDFPLSPPSACTRGSGSGSGSGRAGRHSSASASSSSSSLRSLGQCSDLMSMQAPLPSPRNVANYEFADADRPSTAPHARASSTVGNVDDDVDRHSDSDASAHSEPNRRSHVSMSRVPPATPADLTKLLASPKYAKGADFGADFGNPSSRINNQIRDSPPLSLSSLQEALESDAPRRSENEAPPPRAHSHSLSHSFSEPFVGGDSGLSYIDSRQHEPQQEQQRRPSTSPARTRTHDHVPTHRERDHRDRGKGTRSDDCFPVPPLPRSASAVDDAAEVPQQQQRGQHSFENEDADVESRPFGANRRRDRREHATFPAPLQRRAQNLSSNVLLKKMLEQHRGREIASGFRPQSGRGVLRNNTSMLNSSREEAGADMSMGAGMGAGMGNQSALQKVRAMREKIAESVVESHLSSSDAPGAAAGTGLFQSPNAAAALSVSSSCDRSLMSRTGGGGGASFMSPTKSVMSLQNYLDTQKINPTRISKQQNIEKLLTDLNEKLLAKTRANEALMRQIGEKDVALMSAKKSFEVANKKLAKLEHEVTNERQEAELQKETDAMAVRKAEREASMLRDKVSNLESRYDTDTSGLCSTIKELERDNESLRRVRDTAASVRTEWEDRVASATSECDMLRADLEKAQAAAANEAKERKELATSYDELHREYVALQRSSAEQSEASERDHMEQIRALETSLGDYREKNSELREKVEELEEMRRNLERERDRQGQLDKEARSAASLHLTENSDKIDKWKQEIAEKTSEVERLRAHLLKWEQKAKRYHQLKVDNQYLYDQNVYLRDKMQMSIELPEPSSPITSPKFHIMPTPAPTTAKHQGGLQKQHKTTRHDGQQEPQNLNGAFDDAFAPSRSAIKIQNLQEQLEQRAHEMGEEVFMEKISKLLRPQPNKASHDSPRSQHSNGGAASPRSGRESKPPPVSSRPSSRSSHRSNISRDRERERSTRGGREREMVESRERETVEGRERETVEGRERETVEGRERETVEGRERETVEGRERETVESRERETVGAAERGREAAEATERDHDVVNHGRENTRSVASLSRSRSKSPHHATARDRDNKRSVASRSRSPPPPPPRDRPRSPRSAAADEWNQKRPQFHSLTEGLRELERVEKLQKQRDEERKLARKSHDVDLQATRNASNRNSVSPHHLPRNSSRSNSPRNRHNTIAAATDLDHDQSQDRNYNQGQPVPQAQERGIDSPHEEAPRQQQDGTHLPPTYFHGYLGEEYNADISMYSPGPANAPRVETETESDIQQQQDEGPPMDQDHGVRNAHAEAEAMRQEDGRTHGHGPGRRAKAEETASEEAQMARTDADFARDYDRRSKQQANEALNGTSPNRASRSHSSHASARSSTSSSQRSFGESLLQVRESLEHQFMNSFVDDRAKANSKVGHTMPPHLPASDRDPAAQHNDHDRDRDRMPSGAADGDGYHARPAAQSGAHPTHAQQQQQQPIHTSAADEPRSSSNGVRARRRSGSNTSGSLQRRKRSKQRSRSRKSGTTTGTGTGTGRTSKRSSSTAKLHTSSSTGNGTVRPLTSRNRNRPTTGAAAAAPVRAFTIPSGRRVSNEVHPLVPVGNGIDHGHTSTTSSGSSARSGTSREGRSKLMSRAAARRQSKGRTGGGGGSKGNGRSRSRSGSTDARRRGRSQQKQKMKKRTDTTVVGTDSRDRDENRSPSNRRHFDGSRPKASSTSGSQLQSQIGKRAPDQSGAGASHLVHRETQTSVQRPSRSVRRKAAADPERGAAASAIDADPFVQPAPFY